MSFRFTGKATSLAMQFTVTELKHCTADFSPERKLGEGAYGCVFLGKNLRGTGTNIAVKVLSQVSI